MSWDEPGHIRIDLTSRYPMLDIPEEKQKSNNDELLPITPEFAEMLLAVPEDQRTGPVFKLGKKDPTRSAKLLYISKTISEIGEKANIVVNHDPVKYASAHDFRRAYGLRWADMVMPNDLKEMMRHDSLDTMMKYYIGSNGQKSAAKIYEAFAKKIQDKASQSRNSGNVNTSGNTSENPENQSLEESTQPIDNNEVGE